jgi:predicted flap endonuclease-1-like 5' DNA nuclease
VSGPAANEDLPCGRAIFAATSEIGLKRKMMTLFEVLLALLVGVLIGWLIWGRLGGELREVRASLDRMRSERNALKADADQLRRELEACGKECTILERQLGEAKVAAGSAKGDAVRIQTAARSKKSAAPVASRSAPSGNTPQKTGSGKRKAPTNPRKDNLQRLIGIGPVNERRLKEHGVRTFAQIAAWTSDDVQKVEEYLRFGGRVERERWVEQAKLLAAGEEDEFARLFPAGSKSWQ